MAKKDTEGGFIALRSLPPENLAKVQSDLRTGRSLTALARMIQGEWGMMTHMKENSLVQTLLRYRDRVLVAPLAVALEGKQAKVATLARRVEARLDAVSGMEELVRIQIERIQELRAKEKTLKMPFQWASKEIEVAASMYKELLKMQIDVGIVEFKGPLSSRGVSVTTPDGTKVTVGTPNDQLNNALTEAHALLSDLGVIDVEAKEVHGAGDASSN